MMELDQVLTEVLRLDSDPKAVEKLQALALEYPQWKDQITECWEMHQELTISRETIKSELPANWGHYEIIDQIDRGGMGVVYRARDRQLDRIVALKIIRSGELADEIEVARFRREAQVAANLLHPNIIPIYEVGQEKQLVYFTMAFVDGIPLSRIGSSNLSSTAKVKLVYELAQALQYAHERGVSHRDIKPSNILIDVHGKPVLIDFGLAKSTHAPSDLTVSGMVIGTPAYMAPEQLHTHRSVDFRLSDIYSLGAVLYFLLTGRSPFIGENSFDIMIQLKDREPVRPSRINKHIDRELDAICMRALAKKPEQRYSSASEFAEDLNRWMEGSAITTPTTSLWDKTIRWWREEPGLFSHVTAILTVTLIVILSHLLGYSHSNLIQQISLLMTWLILCVPLQQAVFRVKRPSTPAVLWGLVDVSFVSVLIANAQAPRSLLLIAYPVMITVSALFYRTRFVLLMTIACIGAFVILTETLNDPSMERTDFRFIFVSLLLVECLILTSLIFKVRNLFSYRNS